MYSLLKGQEKDPRKGARQKKDEKKKRETWVKVPPKRKVEYSSTIGIAVDVSGVSREQLKQDAIPSLLEAVKQIMRRQIQTMRQLDTSSHQSRHIHVGDVALGSRSTCLSITFVSKPRIFHESTLSRNYQSNFDYATFLRNYETWFENNEFL